MNKLIDSRIIRLNYLYVDKYLFPSNWAYPKTYTPYAMLRFITKGRGKFIIDDKEVLVEENSMIYISEGTMLACDSTTDWFEFISVRFTTGIKSINILLDKLGSYVLINDIREEIREYFYKMLDESSLRKEGSVYAIRGYLELLFSYLLNEMSLLQFNYNKDAIEKDINPIINIIERSNRNAIKTDVRIQTVLEYLILHQEEHIDLDTIYNMVDMSPSSFRRIFKANTGKAPCEFISEMKMMSAAKRLLATEDRISSIAYELGFDSSNYFARQFKKRFGVSPQMYRQQSREYE